jgi:hypothetical protein
LRVLPPYIKPKDKHLDFSKVSLNHSNKQPTPTVYNVSVGSRYDLISDTSLNERQHGVDSTRQRGGCDRHHKQCV